MLRSLPARLRYTRERARLLDHLPRASVGAEIGVWKGDFSARLLAVVRPTVLHLVDPWRFEPAGYERAWYGGALATSQLEMDAIHASVLARFAAEIATGAVVVHRATSREAAAAIPDESLGWAYIDGNHRYEYVRADLETYARKVTPGGFLGGDDYGSAGWWDDGVRRAVDEFLEREGFEPVLLGGQFLLRRAA